MRTYIVFRSTADGDLQPMELVEANGSHQAIKRTQSAVDDGWPADIDSAGLADADNGGDKTKPVAA